MRLFFTGTRSPYRNLALEEYFWKNSNDEVFMLWQNDPTVVIGKNQNLYNEVRLDEAKRRGVLLARRLTGGGAVYHDLGNVNYSFILPRTAANALDFERFTRPVRDILSALGWNVRLSGRNDLVIDDPETGAEAKFSGSAQSATKERVLHHGTLLFDSDLTVLGQILTPGEKKIQSHGIRSVRSRVVNLRERMPQGEDYETETFFSNLASSFADYFSASWENASDAADPEAVRAYEERNASPGTIYGPDDELTYSVPVPLPAGNAVLRCRLSEGTIGKAVFEGDFFGTYPTEELEKHLEGVPFGRESLESVFSAFPPRDYLAGADERSLLDAWFPPEVK